MSAMNGRTSNHSVALSVTRHINREEITIYSGENVARKRFTVTVRLPNETEESDRFPNHPGFQAEMLERAEEILSHLELKSGNGLRLRVVDLDDPQNRNNTAITVWPPHTG